jgi:hypothetical protein
MRSKFDYIIDKYDGRLQLICAEEGTVVNVKNVLLTIERPRMCLVNQFLGIHFILQICTQLLLRFFLES